MQNRAAWLSKAGIPFEVNAAPMPELLPGHVIIKNAAVAINPVDWKVQETGHGVQKWPTILGADVAGEVYQIGKGVKAVSEGQRVLGYCPSLLGGPPEQAGFQLFTSVPGISLARIPDNLPFENAAVLPLSLSTAAAALYQKGQLALPYPTIPAKPLGKTLLVWGGSSSVGSSAIQLAVASGLNVTSTASPKNYDYVKSLGATYVFDYNDSSVIEDLVKTFKGTEFVGAFDAISTTKTIKQSHEVVSRMGGGKLSTTLSSTAVIPGDVSISNVFAKSIIVDEDDVGRAIYTQFVYPALQKQILRAKPDPYIIHGGLEQIQDAISIQKAGVSAQKIVVSLTS